MSKKKASAKKKYINNIRTFFVENFENLMITLFGSFFTANTISLFLNTSSFFNLEYVNNSNPFIFFLIMFLVNIGTILIGKRSKFRKRTSSLLLISTICFSAFLAFDYPNDITFMVGLFIFNLIVIYYIMHDDKIEIAKANPSDKRTFILIFLGFITITYSVAKYTILRYQGFHAHSYDMGLFSQMFEYMANTGKAMTTLERNALLNHFAVHFSPIFYLILPIYMIFRSPESLLAMQSVIIFSGVFPIYLLCKNKKLPNIYILLISFMYLLYPAIVSGAFFDFHENIFLTSLLLWMFYFLEKEKKLPMFIFMILTLLVKEDAPVYIACVGLYIIFYKRSYKIGGIILVTSILYLIMAFSITSSYFTEMMTNRLEFFPPGESGFIGLFKTLFFNFGYLIHKIMSTDKINFLILILAPLFFIPVANKKISNLILLVPILVVNIMSSYELYYKIDFQYTYGISALLFYALIINISNLNIKFKNVMLVSGFVFTILASIISNYDKLMYYKFDYNDNNIDIKDTRKCLDTIPVDAEITVAPYFAAYLSNHKVMYVYLSEKSLSAYPLFKNAQNLETKYAIADLRYKEEYYEMIEMLNKKGYTHINKCGWADIYQK